MLTCNEHRETQLAGEKSNGEAGGASWRSGGSVNAARLLLTGRAAHPPRWSDQCALPSQPLRWFLLLPEMHEWSRRRTMKIKREAELQTVTWGAGQILLEQGKQANSAREQTITGRRTARRRQTAAQDRRSAHHFTSDAADQGWPWASAAAAASSEAGVWATPSGPGETAAGLVFACECLDRGDSPRRAPRPGQARWRAPDRLKSLLPSPRAARNRAARPFLSHSDANLRYGTNR